VNLTGYVDDIMSLISKSWCSIVPLRVGGGTRLKILEAMALGTPVVATSKGAEGLDVEDGVHLLIADSPEEFSDAVICLLTDDVLRDRITNNAVRIVREKYDSQIVMSKFVKQLQDLVSS
jgi:glycosyltransferase involved in cell wall biosynthesis